MKTKFLYAAVTVAAGFAAFAGLVFSLALELCDLALDALEEYQHKLEQHPYV
jgi:hypothetical protein